MMKTLCIVGNVEPTMTCDVASTTSDPRLNSMCPILLHKAIERIVPCTLLSLQPQDKTAMEIETEANKFEATHSEGIVQRLFENKVRKGNSQYNDSLDMCTRCHEGTHRDRSRFSASTHH